MLSCLDSASSVRSGRSTHWHPPVVCFLILIWIFDNIVVEVWLWCGNNFQRIEIIMKLRLSSFTLTKSDGIREKLLKITKINVHKDCLECHRLEFVKKNSFFFDIACRSGFDRVEKKMTTQFVYSKWWLFLSRLHCKNIFLAFSYLTLLAWQKLALTRWEGSTKRSAGTITPICQVWSWLPHWRQMKRRGYFILKIDNKSHVDYSFYFKT